MTTGKQHLTPNQRYQVRWLGFCLVYTIFAGSLRKWVIQGGLFSNLLLLGHIVLPWVYYFFSGGSRQKFGPLLGIFGGLLLLMAFNPLNQTIYHGVFGVLLHLGFWLICFHYVENRNLYPWQTLVGLLLFVFFLEIALSVVQYSLPRSLFINKYAAEGATSIAYVGERARVTGTFSYVAGFSSWLFFVNLWIWAQAKRGASIRFIAFLTALSILASLISGTRASLAFTIVFALFAFREALKRMAAANFIIVLSVGLILGYTVVQNSGFIQEAWSNFYSRIEDGIRDKEFGRRTYGVLEEVIDFRGGNPLFGAGLGATYQGARLLWGESYFVKQYGGYEEEPERIILEGGFILFSFRMLLLVYFLNKLQLPVAYKLLLGIIVAFFTHTIFNVYNIFFVPLGLSLLDWAYGHDRNPNT